MAGKFLKRALLSIFIDKNARDKLDAIEAVKRGEPAPAPKPAKKAVDDVDDDDILPETLVRQAIESASAELERKKNLPPGRQALIEQALSIHDQQSKMLDDLPDEQREKMIVMAMHAFGSSFDEKNAAETKQTKKKRKKT
ncbi:hypothetical protein L2D14_14380 [Thalassospiraceae bacterium LMO-JJ14]|nr:hypothetical protein L2D14_14380 [Thalassospiraceae bacterium LMO-JJ14]